MKQIIQKLIKQTLKINQTYLIVDKQNQQIESVITNTTKQNTRISSIEQKVGELNSKISDIADITTMQETIFGKLTFDKINQSKPIHIEIRPLNENIEVLHPFDDLYVNDNLILQMRILRFTNTTTGEIFDYELPEDLLYIDNEHCDTFVLDYDTQICHVNKKCKRISYTQVELLENARNTRICLSNN